LAKLKVASAPSSPAPKPLTLAAKALRKLKDEKKKTEERLTTINKRIVEVETIELPKLMEDNEIDKFNVAGVGTIFLSTEVYASVLKEDRPKLYQWARDKGHGGMVGDWIFPNTLTAFVKGQLIDQAENGVTDGNSLPNFIKATKVPTANLRRSK
jgi:hypothetical protein